MSPHASITTPPEPLLPRQTSKPNDPYSLSSLYAELSSLYPELYSSYSYNPKDYSSLMNYYSSILNSYSVSDYSLPTLAPTRTGVGRSTTTGKGMTTGRSTATGLRVSQTAAATSSGEENGSSGGLSTGAKIGIGVGVTLAFLLLAGIGIFLWCMGKRKGKKSSTTIVAPAQPQQTQPVFQQQQPSMAYSNKQGYMPGFQQPPQGVTPPPLYAQTQQASQPGMGGAYEGAYTKGPDPNIAELEHEYHFATPGMVEMGDGVPEREPEPLKKAKKLAKKK